MTNQSYLSGIGKTGAAYSYGYSRSKCTHDGMAQPVLNVGKAGELWGGSMSELVECAGWDLVVSAVGFTSFIKNPITFGGNEEARARLNPDLLKWNPPACIGIDWPDRGVPNLGRAWWKALAKEIKGIDGKVGVCCMGGHGRTGTMLAILVPLLGGLKGKKACPVTWVRKNYCEEAVESDAQIDYVEYITERAVKIGSSDAEASDARVKEVAGGALPNPTSGLTLPTPTYTSPEPLQRDTKTGSLGFAEADHEPTDLELLYAWEIGDGDVTAPIEGTNKRWVPVYDDKGEIAGWAVE